MREKMRLCHLSLNVVPMLTSVAIAASIFMLAACLQRPLPQGTNEIPCNEITGHDLTKLFVISTEETDIPAKLTSQVTGTVEAIPQPEVIINGQPHESTVYKWQTGYANYSLTIYDKTPLFAAAIYHNAPSLGLIIDCLGTPSHYIARYGLLGPDATKPSIRLEIFYKDKGIYYFIETGGRKSSKTNATKISEVLGNDVLTTSIAIKAIQWTLPGDIALMRWRFLYGKLQPTSEDEEIELATYKADPAVFPWPSNIDELEITYTYPELLTPASK